MVAKCVKSIVVLTFSLFSLFFYLPASAQQTAGETAQQEKSEKPGSEKFDANEVIFGHVMDAHEFHFFSYKGSDGQEHHAVIPLPVLLYSPQKGFSAFMSSRFEEGHEVDGYKMVDNKIVATEPGVTVYDLSLTRNVVQMFIAVALLLWLMTSIAKRYKNGQGITTAPKGFQSAIEVVVTFIRDEVAIPNIGHNYKRYMPLLLTLFFFILINTIFGLIPGSANVTGNIAFTVVLGIISFIVILASTNKHYWGHIFWPPVPHGIKPVMIIVEVLSIFTKPFALIIRLFANMLAGHIIIICLISLIFIFSGISKVVGIGFSPVSIAFTVFIYFIEILVAFIQAFIFANLTAVFIGQAMEGDHHSVEDAHNGEPPTEPLIV